jgi:hypothetical protein
MGGGCFVVVVAVVGVVVFLLLMTVFSCSSVCVPPLLHVGISPLGPVRWLRVSTSADADADADAADAPNVVMSLKVAACA